MNGPLHISSAGSVYFKHGARDRVRARASARGILIFTNDAVTYVPTGTRGFDSFGYTLCHENGEASYYQFYITLQVATINPRYLVMSVGRESLMPPSYPFTFVGTLLTANGTLLMHSLGRDDVYAESRILRRRPDKLRHHRSRNGCFDYQHGGYCCKLGDPQCQF